MLKKLKLFFIKPTELFRDYIEKPVWALKLFVIALVIGLYTYGTKILGKDLFIEMMEEKAAAMPPEQAEALRASIAFMNTPMMNLISAVVAAISTVAIILLVALVYKAFIRALKGEIKYKQVLAVYTLAYMASIVGIAVKFAYMYFTGNLLYLDLSPTFKDVLLNNLDPFVIWQSILMVFGISAVSGIPEKKSIIIVAVMWLVALAISFGSVMLAN
ncbi:MAG TPA: YIP1 family protein [Bacillota bacterium]|nr:YIP1 family protein [Clostridiaceae bacterium]HNR03664.1 YIP1 family protein [Bacillota bacterium]HNT03250.1 YIP1 family protein [Bacillota bacterium]HPX68454.1 YIP1 family protein [Bacillota bacterium]